MKVINCETYLNDHPTRVGFRPAFHALWHLKELGVVVDLKDFESTKTWDEAQKADATKVAIIDTPVAYEHPNLVGAIDLALMRDFSATDEGAFVVRKLEETDDKNARRGLAKKIGARYGKLGEKIKKEIDDLDNTSEPDPFARERVQVFGAHGTAVAGLIGARPASVNLLRPALINDEIKGPEIEDLELPYCGVDPFCRITPISVSAAPNPHMLLGAINYAILIEPDVVVVADSWDRPVGEHVPHIWEEVEIAFKELCAVSMVFCAAGNEPIESLVYPASLSNLRPGPWAVGACTSTGDDLTYSPLSDAIKGHGYRMIRTLSSESSRYDRDVKKLDPWEDEDEDLKYPPEIFDECFPPADIITTDVPGQAGYNPSAYDYTPMASDKIYPKAPSGACGKPNEALHYEIASLFCRFSGTSAATAIAAGLISLALAIQRAKTKPPGGRGTAPSASPGDGGEEPPTPPLPEDVAPFDIDAAWAIVAPTLPPLHAR